MEHSWRASRCLLSINDKLHITKWFVLNPAVMALQYTVHSSITQQLMAGTSSVANLAADSEPAVWQSETVRGGRLLEEVAEFAASVWRRAMRIQILYLFSNGCSLKSLRGLRVCPFQMGTWWLLDSPGKTGTFARKYHILRYPHSRYPWPCR